MQIDYNTVFTENKTNFKLSKQTKKMNKMFFVFIKHLKNSQIKPVKKFELKKITTLKNTFMDIKFFLNLD